MKFKPKPTMKKIPIHRHKLNLNQNLIALGTGLLFGLGLSISQMIDRQRVLGFLDIFGNWDSTLLFVLIGAVTTTLITFRFVLKLPRPLWAEGFRLPTRTDIDFPLVTGAIIFGIGWGIAGYCPGPGITAIVLGSPNPILFVASLLLGSLAYKTWSAWLANKNKSESKII
jgi:uncharacterized membrane protein YedE/YeeE